MTIPKSNSIEMSYSISHGGQHENINYIVRLSWTRCNYGGKRPWFICPGYGCHRRVAKLYLVDKYFLCRHCHDLAYSSQREGQVDRLLHKVQKVYHKLGVSGPDDLLFAPKPKGMHETTYRALCDKVADIDLEFFRAMAIKFGKS